MPALGNRFLSIALLGLCTILGSGTLFADPTEAPALPRRLSAWRDGSLQRAVEQRTNLRVARRAPLVKAYNQFLWSVLGAAPPGKPFVVGRQRQFYGKFSVQEYCDSWPALDTHESDFRDFIVRTRRLADRLRAGRRAFMVVTTPSKAATLPKDLPRLQCADGEAQNRIPPRLVAALREAGVPLVDGAAMAKRVARTSPISIFPRYGIHWNEWGAYTTVAAVLGFAAEQLGDPPRKLDIVTMGVEDEPIETTKAREEVMGLYFGPREHEAPKIEFSLEPSGPPRRATLVGDSFAEAMMEVLLRVHAFASIERFNYLTEFHESHPGGLRSENVRVNDIDWQRDVFGSDVIVLEINEMLDLPIFAQVFVKEALDRLPEALLGARNEEAR